MNRNEILIASEAIASAAIFLRCFALGHRNRGADRWPAAAAGGADRCGASCFDHLSPLASSKADICYFDTIGGGLVITSWEQRCKMRSLEAYATDLDAAAAMRRANKPDNPADCGARVSMPADDGGVWRIFPSSAFAPIT